METTQTAPIQFTQSAINEILRLMKEGNLHGTKFMRVGVKGGGCSGMTYILEFDDKKENDLEFVIGSIPCVIDKSHEMYLVGMEIDWQGGLNSRGFTFSNPNASTTCGCGTSFAV